MSTILEQKLNTIANEKINKIIPENIKKDVQIFDVVGTYEGSSGTVEGIKQFATQEEMQADTTAKEGDLAIVYRSEVQNATVDSKFQTATFPDTVVLDTVMTDYVEVRYRAVDSSKMFDCMGQLDSSMFMMDCYTESGSVRIQYTSEDGITYTRTDTTGNPVDFGTEIYYAYSEMWNDVIGKFIQVGGMYFEGLFQYSNVKLNNCIHFVNLDDVTLVMNEAHTSPTQQDWNGQYDNQMYNLDTLYSLLASNDVACTKANIFKDISGNFILSPSDAGIKAQVVYNDSLQPIGLRARSDITKVNMYKIDFTNNTVEPLVVPVLVGTYVPQPYADIVPSTFAFTITKNESGYYTSDIDLYYMIDCSGRTETYTGWNVALNVDYFATINKYIIPATQLKATSDYVYEKEFYGKNGAEVGTLTQGVSNSFADINAAVYNKIKSQYDNMEPRTLTDNNKTIDKNIYCIPEKSDGTPLLDTSNVTNMGSMFSHCTNLTTIPLLDTGNATDTQYMFYSCSNLTTIPLLDTSKVTNMQYMFYYCTNLTEVPLLDTSKVTDMGCMFYYCTNLIEIPLLDTSGVTDMGSMFFGCTNLTTIPLLNTSKVTSMGAMFNDCTNLTTIPQLDTSSVTSMNIMFEECTSLSDESLNNILAMCANATSYTAKKTLKAIGLTSAQATKCTTLSNYSSFTAAGWTTGY